MMTSFLRNTKGFTLVEMAVVLVIMGLILSAFVVPLTTQMEQVNISQARRDLNEAKEALIGFALISGRLPCPDVDNDGIEDACLSTNSTESTSGNLPWSTLGLVSKDPWGNTYHYRVNNAFTTSFLLSTSASGAGINRVCLSNTCGATEASNVPLVIFSSGKNGSIVTTNADELENNDADGNFVNHDYISGANGFDDVVTWVSTELLMNRMVMVGKLP